MSKNYKRKTGFAFDETIIRYFFFVLFDYLGFLADTIHSNETGVNTNKEDKAIDDLDMGDSNDPEDLENTRVTKGSCYDNMSQ